MSFPPRNPNTKINEVRENINSEYAEELKLNIRCDEDDNHIAVLYCLKCETNLCIICLDTFHSSKALSKHEVVRLTQKPEPPIYCHLHPQKTAELVCKELSCEGINKPMCTMCHQYETHKDHKFTLLESEYNRIKTSVANCLKEIESKQSICDKNVDEYDECISTYSSTNSGFWKTERDKIDKFYSDARTLALKTFDDFTNNRIETLKSLQNQYISDKTKLDDMSSKLRNIEEMRKLEVIKSGENVEEMVLQAGKNIDEPADLISSKNCIFKYPDFESLNIQIETPRDVQLRNKQKTPAIFSVNYNMKCDGRTITVNIRKIALKKNKENIDKIEGNYLIGNIMTTKEALSIEDKKNGRLYTYKDGRSVLDLNQLPNDNSIDLSQYKYVAVILCRAAISPEKELKELRKNNWWSKIVYVIDDHFLRNSKDIVYRAQEMAQSDQRIEVMNYNRSHEILDYILES